MNGGLLRLKINNKNCKLEQLKKAFYGFCLNLALLYIGTRRLF